MGKILICVYPCSSVARMNRELSHETLPAGGTTLRFPTLRAARVWVRQHEAVVPAVPEAGRIASAHEGGRWLRDSPGRGGAECHQPDRLCARREGPHLGRRVVRVPEKDAQGQDAAGPDQDFGI